MTIILILICVFLAILLGLWLWGEQWHPLRPSTLRFMHQVGLKQILNGSALHGYFYGRWVKEYIGLLIHHIFPRVGSRGKLWLSNHYHGKVLTPEQAKAIITNEKEVSLRDLEQVIPYSMARNLVLKGPPDIAVFQCGCRQNRANPCQPVEVCMVIGQPFVDFVLEHHPRSSRRLTQAEALELLKEEHERGHLHSAWFKDVLLNRFYAICNCCKCCCGGIEAMVKYGAPMMVSSGYVAKVDDSNCTACGTCVGTCPFSALSIDDEVLKVSWKDCMGCGVCEAQCPCQAIALVRDEKKGIPLDVQLLAQEQVKHQAGML